MPPIAANEASEETAPPVREGDSVRVSGGPNVGTTGVVRHASPNPSGKALVTITPDSVGDVRVVRRNVERIDAPLRSATGVPIQPVPGSIPGACVVGDQALLEARLQQAQAALAEAQAQLRDQAWALAETQATLQDNKCALAAAQEEARELAAALATTATSLCKELASMEALQNGVGTGQ